MFQLTVFYEGDYNEEEYDKFIERTVGGELDSSGYGFGERDFSFRFPTLEAAKLGYIRAKGIERLQVCDIVKEDED